MQSSNKKKEQLRYALFIIQPKSTEHPRYLREYLPSFPINPASLFLLCNAIFMPKSLDCHCHLAHPTPDRSCRPLNHNAALPAPQLPTARHPEHCARCCRWRFHGCMSIWQRSKAELTALPCGWMPSAPPRSTRYTARVWTSTRATKTSTRP